MRFLVTAGNTQERIDRVRQWSNIFTGNTGLAIARALAERGEVDLLTSNISHLAELSRSSLPGLRAEGFTDHADLRQKLAAKMGSGSYGAVFMSAAVADYRPAGTFSVVSRTTTSTPGQETWIVQNVQAGKVKSNFPAIAVLGEQTEKLVDLFRKQWNFKGLLVKFKLEVGISADDLIRIGQASRVSSGAEYLVANSLDMVEGPNAGAYLLSEAGAEWIPRGALAGRLVQVVKEFQGAS